MNVKHFCCFTFFEKKGRRFKSDFPTCDQPAAYEIMGPKGKYYYCQDHWQQMHDSFNDYGRNDWVNNSRKLP